MKKEDIHGYLLWNKLKFKNHHFKDDDYKISVSMPYRFVWPVNPYTGDTIMISLSLLYEKIRIAMLKRMHSNLDMSKYVIENMFCDTSMKTVTVTIICISTNNSTVKLDHKKLIKFFEIKN